MKQRAPSAEAVATITIDRIAAGGDGVGRLDGLAVFVPRTAPGDVAQIAYRVQGRLGRGRVLQRLTSSAERVDAACAHYDADQCGGCQLQHLNSDSQRVARQHIVQESLARIARREIALPSLTSGVDWGYRGRLTLTLQQKGGRWIGGLHPHDDARRIFSLDACPIAHPALVAVWHIVRSQIKQHAMPAASPLRLSLRLDPHANSTSSGTDVAVVVQGGMSWDASSEFAASVLKASRVANANANGSANAPANATANATANAGPSRISSVWWTNDQGVTTWCGGDTSSVTPTADLETADDSSTAQQVDFAPSATEALAFAQVNEAVADALRARVFGAVTEFRPARVLDAYAGTGPLTEQLALAGVEVVAIESDRAGANAAIARMAQHDEAARKRVRVVCDLVERALPTSSSKLPDVVVVNPPRRGVDARVTSWLDAAPRTVRGVVYISCNPATLARDLARMKSWTIAHVECFDMFPQTAHVETVCVLQRTTDQEAA